MPRRAARRPPRRVVRDGAAEARPRWPTSRLPGRSGTLLASLLLLLAVGPWLDERLVAFALWELLFTLVMLSGIASLSGNRRQALVAALLGLPAIACLWLRQFVPAP